MKPSTVLYKSLGFTLVEIVIVMVIMGSLAAAAIPKFSLSMARAKARDALNNMVIIHAAQQLYFANNGSYLAAGTTQAINTGLSINIISTNGTAYSCTATATAACTAILPQFTVSATLGHVLTGYTSSANASTDNPSCTGEWCP